MLCWPLSSVLVRLLWLRALCGVAEGAAITAAACAGDPALCVAACAGDPALCVAAVLDDPQKRLCILGGRGGMPRSLGSVLGSIVARFLGGIRGMESRIISTRCAKSWCSNVAISRDGTMLLVTDCSLHCVQIFHVATGAHLHSIGSRGSGPLQFQSPRQICIAPDDFVFVADGLNHRIQVLTPRYEFHSFVGKGVLSEPRCVCATNKIIFVAETFDYGITVFNREDGALLRRFGTRACGVDRRTLPLGLCFMPKSSLIASADYWNNRVFVFTLEGELVRQIGVCKLWHPMGIAISNTEDELVVAGEFSITVFSIGGEKLLAFETKPTAGIAIHGGSIFAQRCKQCVQYT